MKAFHDNLVTKLNSILDGSGNQLLKRVDLYRGQDIAQDERENEQILYPAVFITYNLLNVQRLACGQKNFDLNIDLRVLIEGYKTRRADDLDIITRIDNNMTNFRGGTEDALQFSSFQQVNFQQDTNHATESAHILTYQTLYRNLEAFNFITQGKQTVDPVTLDLTGEIKESL